MQPSALTSHAGPHAAATHAGPPWRIVVALAAGVLAAHAWVLQMPPARIAVETIPASKSVTAFVTRSIAPPPATVTPPATPAPPAASVAAPKKKPILKKKTSPAQSPPAQEAIEIIATPIPESRIDDALTSDKATSPETTSDAADATAASEAEVLTATTTAAEPPASAASAPALDASQTPVTTVTTVSLPSSVQLDYTMTGNSKGLTYHANGELNWQNAGSTYNASMTVKALFIGSRSMRSTGQVSEQGLAPSRFSDKSRTEVAAHFEPEKGQISFSANTPTLPWTQGAQDRVSVFMQLGGMLAGNPAAYPVGTRISIRTVGPRDADTWTFAVEGEEQLNLPFGTLATVKVSRAPRQEYDQKLEIWYAPALGYLPVKNKITQANGDFVDQELKGLARP